MQDDAQFLVDIQGQFDCEVTLIRTPVFLRRQGLPGIETHLASPHAQNYLTLRFTLQKGTSFCKHA